MQDGLAIVALLMVVVTIVKVDAASAPSPLGLVPILLPLIYELPCVDSMCLIASVADIEYVGERTVGSNGGTVRGGANQGQEGSEGRPAVQSL